MTSLNQFKGNFAKLLNKKNSTIGLFFALLLVSGFLLILKIISPLKLNLPQTVIQNSEKDPFKIESFNFVKEPDLPSEMAVWEAKKEVFDLESAKKIAKNLGFSQNPKANNDPVLGLSFRWEENNNYLKFNPAQEQLSFSKNRQNQTSSSTGSQINTEEAQSLAQKTLEDIGLWKENLKIVKTNKIKDGVENNELQDNSFDLIEFNYGLFIGSDPIYYETPLDFWAKIQISKDKQILRLDYKNPPQLGKNLGESKIIGSKEILNSLSQGQGVVKGVVFKGQNEGLLQTKNIKEMQILSTKIAYYFPQENQNLLTPILVLEGDIKTEDGLLGQATIYLPANLGKN